MIRGVERPEPLVERVRRTIADLGLLHRGERVVVGVSGGPDSVALLHLLAQLRAPLHLRLYALHVDHQLRADSAADAEFVRALAGQLALPAVIERRDVAAQCRAARWSLEEGARRLRYQCFLEAAQRYSAGAIALAHTADDQAQTVLMRLLRGSGVTGLSGIPVARLMNGVRIVRPLLHVWRQDVIEYLREAGLAYRHDATNEELRFLRNRIRRQLLPLLERRYNPNIKAALVQLAEQSQTDNAFLQAAAQRQWRRVAKPTPAGQVAVSRRLLARQPLALQRQVVREAVRHLQGDLNQFEFRHWLEIERLLDPHASDAVVDLPGGVRVSRAHDRLVFHRAEEGQPPPLAFSQLAPARREQYTKRL